MNYKFFVAILAAMMFSVVLPTMSSYAQSTSGAQTSIMSPSDLALASNDAEKILESCIQQFQGADSIYCDHYYTTQVARSGQLSQPYRYASSINSIIVYENTKVTLSGLKSSTPDFGKVLTYQWGQTAGDKVTFSPKDTAPVISFIAPPVPPREIKTLTISLTVNDGYGLTDTTTFNVIVLHVNQPPTVQVNPDQVVSEGDAVPLSCTATDADSDPLTMTWGQYSGTTVDMSSQGSSNTLSASFTAPQVQPGKTSTLLFVCSADDGHGGKASAMTKVTVKSTHQNPSVVCQDVSVNANSLVRLPAGVSNPSGDSLSYYWRQISGPQVKLSSYADLNPTFVAPTQNGGSGELTFELDVTDPLANIPSCDVTVRINNLSPNGLPPVANAGPDQTTDPSVRVVLDGSASIGDGLSYTWTQTSGDPVTLMFANTAHPVFFSPYVDYGQQKVLEFKLTVSNLYGQDSDTVQITVVHGQEPPTARIVPVP